MQSKHWIQRDFYRMGDIAFGRAGWKNGCGTVSKTAGVCSWSERIAVADADGDGDGKMRITYFTLMEFIWQI